MSITERERRNLYEGLEQVLGPTTADTLMQLLPQSPADELVTISYFQSEMGALRAELTGEMAELRGEMAELRSELTGDMKNLRTELKGDMNDLRVELRGEMNDLRVDLTGDMNDLRTSLESKMTRWMATIMAGNTIAVVTALLT